MWCSGATLICVVCVFGVLAQNAPSSNLNPKIVGGRPAVNASEFPYIVSIRRTEFEEFFGYGNHMCGGTIIDKNTVVTAAHCMFDSHNNFLGNSESFMVVAGVTLLKPKVMSSQVRKVTKIFVHPNYEPDTLEHDIAVLKLKQPLKLNGKTVNSIELQQHEVAAGVECSTHGWGYTKYNSGILSNDLLTIDIPIYDHDNCTVTFKKAGMKIFNTTACAGVPSGALDTCNGDSGGPLVCNNTLTGIVSFGYECAVPKFPGVYTKISDYLDYIADPASFNGTFHTTIDWAECETENAASKSPPWRLLFVVFVMICIMQL